MSLFIMIKTIFILYLHALLIESSSSGSHPKTRAKKDFQYKIIYINQQKTINLQNGNILLLFRCFERLFSSSNFFN